MRRARYCADILQDGNFGNSAILYRTNAQSRIFEKVFRQQNIPYRLVGTVSFYSREEVKDSLAYLGFLSNPADEVAFRRIINKPARGIGAVSLKKILTRNGMDRVVRDLDSALLSAEGFPQREGGQRG